MPDVTPYEVEVKLRADHDVVRPRLGSLGFERTARETQVDRYFDVPHRDFVATDEALRVRTVEDRVSGRSATTLTYKGPRVETSAPAKARTEHSCEVGDGSALIEILGSLGCEHAGTVEKRRERFERDRVVVALDDVTDLGTFVEIERVAAVDDRRSAEAAVESVRADLGLEDAETVERTYLEMVLGNA